MFSYSVGVKCTKVSLDVQSLISIIIVKEYFCNTAVWIRKVWSQSNKQLVDDLSNVMEEATGRNTDVFSAFYSQDYERGFLFGSSHGKSREYVKKKKKKKK